MKATKTLAFLDGILLILCDQVDAKVFYFL
jgi:hypothetical protein